MTNKLKIDILCMDGSPIGVVPSTIWGDTFRVGVGGAELALLTMFELWQEQGHDVTLYNDPHVPSLSQAYIADFKPDADRDILIVFRSANPMAIGAKGKKVWWSCDQYSTGDYKQFAPHMDKIVCISPFHVEYFKTAYGIQNAIHIDIPIRYWDFPIVDRVPNRLIFTSVPDRGLHNLYRIYTRLRKEIQGISLDITSDYRLWGSSAGNEQYRVKFVDYPEVRFYGALSRRSYLNKLSQADLLVYPCHYDELFCIAVAEAGYMGAYPITSTQGALRTTNMGRIIDVNSADPANDHLFIDVVVQASEYRDALEFFRGEVVRKSVERYDKDTILAQWDEVFHG